MNKNQKTEYCLYKKVVRKWPGDIYAFFDTEAKARKHWREIEGANHGITGKTAFRLVRVTYEDV